jgi:vancomycin resistance protein VanW
MRLNFTFARRFLRGLVPLALRRPIANFKRRHHDRAKGYVFATERLTAIAAQWHTIASLVQPLIVAPHLEEKRANLAKAIGAMNGLTIKPGQVLSIWHCLGPPTAKRGWASGRTIINDVMTTDPGGGLCQFSSLIYHLSLLAGLAIVERHHHSRDIHQSDATRFTPLGLDATIVHGFKDLRLRNDGDCDLVLTFELTQSSLTGSILSSKPIASRVLHIRRSDGDLFRQVIVMFVKEAGTNELISDDLYAL